MVGVGLGVRARAARLRASLEALHGSLAHRAAPCDQLREDALRALRELRLARPATRRRRRAQQPPQPRVICYAARTARAQRLGLG